VLDRKDEQGETVADWLRRYGQDPGQFASARIAPGSLAAIVELHIEQGPNLEEAKIPIGVVQGIVGLRRWKCVATGTANHAGTTPMTRRHDALATAARELLAVRDSVRAEDGRQVGTVGYIKAEPGAPNVIAGQVEFPYELRDLDTAKIERMYAATQKRFADIDREEGTAIVCTEVNHIEPALGDPCIQATIREAARTAGLATMDQEAGGNAYCLISTKIASTSSAGKQRDRSPCRQCRQPAPGTRTDGPQTGVPSIGPVLGKTKVAICPPTCGMLVHP